MTQRDGQVVTFYSYKGGTGRTMALANTAWILAANGHRVLVADWDLESPGLHRFFGPFIEPAQVVSNGGVMDLVGEYQWAITEENPDRPADWHREYAKVEKYAFSIKWDHFPKGGSLDILLAGQHNPDYTANVTGLDWDTFYRLGGAEFVDALREDMKQRYDYVLIDSRTGISDVAEICTLHLPDVLVDCFTLSYQGIDGAQQIAERVAEYEGVRSRRVLPVPMRVDDGEKTKADAGRALAKRRFAGLPFGMTEAERRQYWLTVEVPYKTFYAYEETLATFGDQPGARNTLLAAYETLTGYITNGRVTRLPQMDETLRNQTIARFNRKPAIADETIVLRYAAEDHAWAEWVLGVLGAAGARVVDPAVPAAESESAARDLLLLSGSFTDRSHGPSAIALYLDDTELLPEIPVENAISLAGVDAGDAVRQLLRLVGSERPLGDGRQAFRPPRYPGEPPQVFRAPIRNVGFTGRGPLLRQLRAELKSAGNERTPVALYGGGGIGKTQLALEYAYRFRGAYDVVWWIDADPKQFVDIRFADLADELRLPVQPSTPDVTRILRQWLSRTERRADGEPIRWLLIFDNVDRYEDIEEFLPQGNGHVLITTRNAVWGDVARSIDVDAFELAESVQHIQQRVTSRPVSVAEAEQLALAVENLPIFVAMAAAWLAASAGASVADYIAELERTDPTTGLSADVWDMSLQRLMSDSPGAFRLLQLASVLAPEISLDLLYSDQIAKIIAPHDPKVAAQLADRVSERNIAVALVRSLNRLALIKFDPQAKQIQVHRLLQVALQKRMDDRERDEVKHDVHLVLAGSRPSGDVEEPALRQRLRILWPHLDNSGAAECLNDNVRQLVIDRVRYIWLLGGYDQGLRYAEDTDRVWSAQLASLAPDSPRHRALLVQLLHLRFNRANLLRSLGRFEDARALDEATLQEQERVIGESHPHTLMTASGYGGDLRALGRYAEALRRDLKTYQISVREVGEDDRQSLAIANNLATSYRLMGDFQRALDLDRKTHASWLATAGPDFPRTLLSANNLARDRREAGDYDESVQLLEQVLTGYRTLYGEQSREALMAQANLAGSLRGRGDVVRAAELLDKAYAGMQEILGADHPETVLSRLGRAANLMMLRKTSTAATELAAAEDAFIRLFGADHPYVMVCRLDRAVAMWDEGARTEAQKIAIAAVESLESTVGPDHPFTMAGLNNVGVFTIELGLIEPGRASLAEAVRRLTAALHDGHPDTLRSKGNLALSNEPADAGSPSRERARIVERLGSHVGQHHPSVVALREGRFVRRILDPHPY